jgi:hypothetical protein
MSLNLADVVSLTLRRDFLTCHKILRHGAGGFTSRPKEVVLRIFIAFKSPSLSAGLESVNLVSNGKYAKATRISCHTVKNKTRVCTGAAQLRRIASYVKSVVRAL